MATARFAQQAAVGRGLPGRDLSFFAYALVQIQRVLREAPRVHRRRGTAPAWLRAVERAYRIAIEHDAGAKLEPAMMTRSADHVADHEMELE